MMFRKLLTLVACLATCAAALADTAAAADSPPKPASATTDAAAAAATPEGADDEEAGATGAPAAAPTTRSSFTRIPPRPTQTPEQYTALAKFLRGEYAKPREQWPKPTLDDGVELVELGPMPTTPVFPEDNPYTKEKAELGLRLFFDPRLSGSGQIACANCHDPELSWTDGRSLSFGHARRSTKRNSPSLLTASFGKSFFWDGRSTTLEEQAVEPITADGEMHGDPAVVTARLAKVPGYRERFKAAFGDEQVTMPRIGKAIATFERSIIRMSGKSKFDRFLGGERGALSDEAVRGLHLFRTTARCLNCHNGPLLTDGKFHDVGLSYYGRKLQDLGRYEITKRPEDVGAFRTPTLRNVAQTAPYMHNGLFQLDGVINMYNAGMPTLRRKEHQRDDPLFPTKSPLLKPLGLNRQDHADLKAFLESLNDRRVRLRPEPLPDEER